MCVFQYIVTWLTSTFGPELEQLRKFHAGHAAEIERLGAQAASLSKDLENYRRFKDALDAANKIAGGS